MKKIIIISLIALVGCGGESGSGGGQTYLASQIVFRNANASTLAKSATNGDTIYADQVIINSATLGIDATTVQEAFDQTQPDLASSIIGIWSLSLIGSDCQTALTDEGSYSCDGGSVAFESDGTVNFSGAAETTGPFSGVPNSGDEVGDSATISTTEYQIFENSYIILKTIVMNPTTPEYWYTTVPIYQFTSSKLSLENSVGLKQ